MTIRDLLTEQTIRLDALALSWYCDGTLRRRYTRLDLREQVGTAIAHLIQLNVGYKDRVVVLSNNTPEMFFLLLAVMSLGAIVAPVNPQESAQVVRHILSTLEPSLVVISSAIEPCLVEIAASRRCASIEELFAPGCRDTSNFSGTNVAEQDLAVILFTSGTTSVPKGVCLSHGNLLTNARGLYKIHSLSENSVHLCMLPLFHANAFGFSLVTSIFAGSHVVLCNGLPGYSVWSIIASEKVNIVSVVPQILQILSARPPARGPGEWLRYFVSAAAPLSRKVLTDFINATGVRVHQGYGLSECVNFATTIPADVADSTYERAMFAERMPSIGTPLEGCDVFVCRLRHPRQAVEEEEGEIVVTGDTLMSGYWQNEEATQQTIVEGGLRTGDLGFFKVLEGRRFFFITGRSKEIIIRHGEKISPLAVESDLQELHAFGKFAVAGFENAAVGEEIGLYVQQTGRVAHADIARLVNTCAALSRPRLVMIGQQPIPLTATGKVRRARLAQRFMPFSGHVFGKEPVLVEDTTGIGQCGAEIE
jgi:long-chain acyl-CoA synthetase